jgi:hypothetical protein
MGGKDRCGDWEGWDVVAHPKCLDNARVLDL